MCSSSADRTVISRGDKGLHERLVLQASDPVVTMLVNGESAERVEYERRQIGNSRKDGVGRGGPRSSIGSVACKMVDGIHTVSHDNGALRE